MKHLHYIIILSITLFISGCDLFDYSVHEVKGRYSGKNINANNAALIESMYKDPSADFSFALITDSHTSYDEMEKALGKIASTPGVLFVVHAGDFTDTGILFQYEQTISLLEDLPMPYFVVLGNHDALGNGQEIFEDILGPKNFHFVCNNVFFGLFDDNVWESNIESLDYAESTLSQHMSESKRIIISHIPIVQDDRFTDEFLEEFNRITFDYKVDLSIFGHWHQYDYLTDYNGFSDMLMANAIIKNIYYIVHVRAGGIEVESVNF